MAFKLPHWRLTCITLFHTAFGYANMSLLTIFPPMGEWTKTLANTSITAHYNTQPSPKTIDWIWSSLNAIFVVGNIIGFGSLQFVAEKLGRRNTVMVFKNVIVIIAVLTLLLSQPLNSIELLLIGRLFSGMTIGPTALVDVYLAELSPTQDRGTVSTFSVSVGSRLWLFIGSLLTIFATEANWPYCFLCALVPSLIHLGATALFPKSVKHLYITVGNKEKARKASQYCNGPQADLDTMQSEMSQEADISPTLKVVNLRLIFVASQFRWPLLLSMAPICSYALGGFDVAMFYSANIMLDAGVDGDKLSLYYSFCIHFPSLVLAVFSVYFIENFGRRPLLLTGVFLAGLGAFCLCLITPLETVSESLSSVFGVLGLSLVVLGFTIGPGPLAFTLPAEIAPQASRSLTAGLSGTTNSVLGLFVTLFFPLLTNWLNSYVVVFIVLYDVTIFVFLWKFLPEPKGKSVAEIVSRWMPARKNAVEMGEYGQN